MNQKSLRVLILAVQDSNLQRDETDDAHTQPYLRLPTKQVSGHTLQIQYIDLRQEHTQYDPGIEHRLHNWQFIEDDLWEHRQWVGQDKLPVCSVVEYQPNVPEGQQIELEVLKCSHPR